MTTPIIQERTQDKTEETDQKRKWLIEYGGKMQVVYCSEKETKVIVERFVDLGDSVAFSRVEDTKVCRIGYVYEDLA